MYLNVDFVWRLAKQLRRKWSGEMAFTFISGWADEDQSKWNCFLLPGMRLQSSFALAQWVLNGFFRFYQKSVGCTKFISLEIRETEKERKRTKCEKNLVQTAHNSFQSFNLNKCMYAAKERASACVGTINLISAHIFSLSFARAFLPQSMW